MNDAARDPVDDMSGGLRAAFAGPAAAPGSVLRLLQQQSRSQLDLHLRDAGDPAEVPVRMDDEARSLRDPSGRYQILGEIGRGGVGVVYKGRDQDLGRDVAMKVLRPEHLDRPEILERFIEEAQIGGQLQHPGIVPVYEVGLRHGARPYFAMKLVKGETLAALLARRTWPDEDRRRLLGIFEQVCQTLAYAHARRVVHRDLKPQNIMLGSFGEVQVVDWGFAKVLPEGEPARPAVRPAAASVASVISTVRSDPDKGTHSAAGSMLGTPAYMAPEQAIGDVAHVDRRSDVFGLGAILCEILTGQPPYREQDGDLIQQAARADLQGAYERIDQSGVDAALAALCKQCLSPAPKARPESARQLADQVGRHLASVEERAREAQIHAAEARVRARSTLLLSAAAVLLLALGGGTWLFVQRQAQARRDQASQRLASAINEANVRLGEARAAEHADLGLWTRAFDAAMQAETLAADADVGDEQRAGAAALLGSVRQQRVQAREQVERAARDTAMRQRLLEARIPVDDDIGAKGYWTKEVRRRNEAYAAAFLTYLGGRNLTAMTADAGADALAGPMAIELAAALDHWAAGRIYLVCAKDADPPDGETTMRLVAMAMALDPDPWRNRLRLACARPQLEREAVVRLQTEADLRSLSVVSLALLGSTLWNVDAMDAARVVYQTACERHPADFGCVFSLGRLHESAGEWREAALCFRIAHALRPQMREARHRLGIALGKLADHAAEERVFGELAEEDPSNGHWQAHLGTALDAQGRREDAIACFHRAIALGSDDARTHTDLGVALADHGRVDDAIARFRHAIEIEPDIALTYFNLGSSLRQLGMLDEAIASLHRAVQLDPTEVRAHNELGAALAAQGKLEEAIACWQRTAALDPKVATPHVNLGRAYAKQGRLDEAVASFREALQREPGHAACHTDLGILLQQQGRLDESKACFESALALDPKDVMAHCALADTFAQQDQLDAAIASYRRAVHLDPDHAVAHHNLGGALARQGRLHEAVESLRRAQAIWSEQGGPASRLAEVEATIRGLESELTRADEHLALARGERGSARKEDFTAAADLVYRRRDYLLAARTYARAFTAFPELLQAWPHRYRAACAAALACCGQGEGADALDDEARATLRSQAREWLAPEIERCRVAIAAGGPSATRAAERLEQIGKDQSLEGLRSDAALQALPAEERAAWRRLWQDLERIRADRGEGK